MSISQKPSSVRIRKSLVEKIPNTFHAEFVIFCFEAVLTFSTETFLLAVYFSFCAVDYIGQPSTFERAH